MESPRSGMNEDEVEKKSEHGTCQTPSEPPRENIQFSSTTRDDTEDTEA